MAERLSTGLAGLDAQFGGGIPPGTVHVLIAEPMNSLDLFTRHFASAAHGGCLFVATDDDEDSVRSGVQMVGGRPERVKVSPLDVTRGARLPAVPRGARYVLHTFSAFSHAAGWDEAFGQLSALRRQVRAAGTTLLATVIGGLHSEEEISLLKLWADGVMELGFDRQGFGLYPFLKVTKMRGVPDSARFLLFKETPKGLFMESTRRVF